MSNRLPIKGGPALDRILDDGRNGLDAIFEGARAKPAEPDGPAAAELRLGLVGETVTINLRNQKQLPANAVRISRTEGPGAESELLRRLRRPPTSVDNGRGWAEICISRAGLRQRFGFRRHGVMLRLVVNGDDEDEGMGTSGEIRRKALEEAAREQEREQRRIIEAERERQRELEERRRRQNDD